MAADLVREISESYVTFRIPYDDVGATKKGTGYKKALKPYKAANFKAINKTT